MGLCLSFCYEKLKLVFIFKSLFDYLVLKLDLKNNLFVENINKY